MSGIVARVPSGVELCSNEVRALSISNLRDARLGLTIDPQATIAARRIADPVVIGQTLMSHYVLAVNRGELHRAKGLHAEVAELLEGDLTRLGRPFYPTLLAVHGIALGLRLDYHESERVLRLGVAVAEALPDPNADIGYLVSLGRNYSRQGRLCEAISLIAELQSREHVPASVVPAIQIRVAELFAKQGLWEQAAERFAAVLESGRTVEERRLVGLATSLAQSLAGCGETDDARRWIAIARSNSIRLGWPVMTAIVDQSEARVALDVGDWKRAEALASRAVSNNATLGCAYAELTSREALAQAFLQAGQPERALDVTNDERVRLLGPWHQSQIAEVRTEAHRQLGDWKMVVEEQNRFRRKTAEVRVGLAELVSASAAGKNTDVLREQRIGLAAANRTLVAAQEEKAELLNIVAHDLKSPLTALALTLRFLDAQHGENDLHKIDKAEGMVARIQAITAQLSTLNELERGSAVFELVEVDIEPIVARVVQRYEWVARSKSIDLMFIRGAPATNNRAWVDEAQLDQVLENLISNALKYSEEGRVVEVTCEARERGGQGTRLEISIVDGGLGLSEPDLGEVFSKYSRLSSRPTGGESSSGLGLYIARSIARAMGGDISATSPGKGHGSTFVVALASGGSAPVTFVGDA